MSPEGEGLMNNALSSSPSKGGIMSSPKGEIEGAFSEPISRVL